MIGYARVSTDDQDLALQLRELRRAGCVDGHIHTDKRSAVARRREGFDAAAPDTNDHHTLCMTFEEMHAVVDEAHKLKNRATQQHQAIVRIRRTDLGAAR